MVSQSCEGTDGMACDPRKQGVMTPCCCVVCWICCLLGRIQLRVEVECGLVDHDWDGSES